MRHIRQFCIPTTLPFFDSAVLTGKLDLPGYYINRAPWVRSEWQPPGMEPIDPLRESKANIDDVNAVHRSPIEIINISLNQTLSRTIITSLTTFVVLLSLFLFGGEIIHGFATALMIGVIIGTYSSIFVASVAVVMLGIRKEDLMPKVKEGELVDDRP